MLIHGGREVPEADSGDDVDDELLQAGFEDDEEGILEADGCGGCIFLFIGGCIVLGYVLYRILS